MNEIEVSQIKTLVNEGKSVDEIIKLFPHTTKGRINSIKYGSTYTDVAPLTAHQLRRKKNPRPERQVIPQVIPITRNPRNFPITVRIENEFIYQVWQEALKKEEKRLLVELAKVTLQIHAIETNDYSNLSESLQKEMEELLAKVKNGEDITKIA